MKILIAIMSCARDKQYHQRARETWLKNSPVDYKFVLGSQTPLKSDELSLNAPDDYWGLKLKVKELFRYALEHEYDYVFKCDIDTYVYIPRLLKSGFENYDWSGYGQPYGGSGYWVSRRSMEYLVNDTLDYDKREGEDWWAFRILSGKHLVSHQDSRYHSLTNEGPSPENEIITSHWYSDGDRAVHSKERLALIPVYHTIAQKI